MEKKRIKTNDFVHIDCLSTLFACRLHYIKYALTSGFKITSATHTDTKVKKKIKLLSDEDARF